MSLGECRAVLRARQVLGKRMLLLAVVGVVTHYWVTAFWADKAGKGEPPETTRITHTWIKTTTGGGWQILGGMSCPSARKERS